MDPRIVQWFLKRIGQPTEVQVKAWDNISKGNHGLIVSPTGSGKTLAAVLPAVDPILKGVSPR
jgi:ATP-dependent Lhr-like helicase